MQIFIYIFFAFVILRAIYKKGSGSTGNKKPVHFDDSAIQNQMMMNQQIQNQALMDQQNIQNQISDQIHNQMHHQVNNEPPNMHH